ncbi:predicted protein [Naegleria gruberi]|uniref:Predicted protein n=1 Tax=Naegleria gruberi TaxID=5762 RepID=D2V8W0_NAEGR|nr:uncharacterized protein NAEGRDRAFT_65301 [Naegleria gruberi]EFC46870.1 predicted protein [Naegleria gruberi]|eukprot:XP_002679614.1 predicted protein [Naegleria gruberi strain NEG-M]
MLLINSNSNPNNSISFGWTTLTKSSFHQSLKSFTFEQKDQVLEKINRVDNIKDLEKLYPDMESYTIVCCGNGCQNCVMNDYLEIVQRFEERRQELKMILQ